MEALLDEIESLEAILMNDVKIIKNLETGFPELIETIVLPTVGEEIDRQYVCITLQVMPTANYPDTQPKYQLRNPRGLDDQNINAIKVAIEEKLHKSIGAPVVFDLIEVIREHLTDSNLPSGQCVVCLYGFQDGDAFTKTECYHYLHSFCLARHFSASKKNYQEEQDKLPAWQRLNSKPYQAFCPVCREPINNDVNALERAQPPTELENAPVFELTNDLKGLQVRMANLFMHQKQRGGIIDLKADESNVISIDDEENREEQLPKSTVQMNSSYSSKAQHDNSKQITSTSNVPNSSRRDGRSSVKSKDNKTHSASGDSFTATVAATTADSKEDDDDGREQRHGRRGGKNRSRNGYQHHHHRHPHRRNGSSNAGSNNTDASGSNAR